MVTARHEIAALSLYEAVETVVANDDVSIPDGFPAIEYLTGVRSLAIIGEIYAVPAQRVARLALRIRSQRQRNGGNR